MPVINIPIKEWGADMAEQAKRKAQAAMQGVQDAGGEAIEEAQRKAQAARDEWLKQQIDQAMAPIREAGHSAAEGLGALAQNAGENLQQNVEAVQQAPVAQAIGEKASDLGTAVQGKRQEINANLQAGPRTVGEVADLAGQAVSETPIGESWTASQQAQQAMDQTARETTERERGQTYAQPGELLGPPQEEEGGPTPFFTAPTTGTPEGEAQIGKLAETAMEQTPGGRFMTDVARSATSNAAPMTADKPVENLATMGGLAVQNVGAPLPLGMGQAIPGGQAALQPVASAVMKALPGGETPINPNVDPDTPLLGGALTPDEMIPFAVGALTDPETIAGAANKALNFRVPGAVRNAADAVSTRLDEAGRAAMGDGRLAISDGAVPPTPPTPPEPPTPPGGGTPPIGDIPEPQKFPDMHTTPDMRRGQPGPDSERTRIPSFDREAFPSPEGGLAQPPSDALIPEGSLPFTPPRRGLLPNDEFPDPHAVGERGLGEVDLRRIDEPYGDGALHNTFTMDEDEAIDLAIQNGEIGDTDEPTNRQVLEWVQENFDRHRGPGETPQPPENADDLIRRAGETQTPLPPESGFGGQVPLEPEHWLEPPKDRDLNDFVPDSEMGPDPTAGMTQAEKDEYWYGGSDFPGQEQSPLMQAFEATGRERRRIAREQGLEVDWLPNDELGRLGEDDFQRMLRDRTHRPFVDDRFTPRGEPTEPPSGMSQVPGETGRPTGMERLPREPRPEPGPGMRDEPFADRLDVYMDLSPSEKQAVEDAMASGELTMDATVGEVFDHIDRKLMPPETPPTPAKPVPPDPFERPPNAEMGRRRRAGAKELGVDVSHLSDEELGAMTYSDWQDEVARQRRDMDASMRENQQRISDEDRPTPGQPEPTDEELQRAADDLFGPRRPGETPGNPLSARPMEPTDLTDYPRAPGARSDRPTIPEDMASPDVGPVEPREGMQNILAPGAPLSDQLLGRGGNAVLGGVEADRQTPDDATPEERLKRIGTGAFLGGIQKPGRPGRFLRGLIRGAPDLAQDALGAVEGAGDEARRAARAAFRRDSLKELGLEPTRPARDWGEAIPTRRQMGDDLTAEEYTDVAEKATRRWRYWDDRAKANPDDAEAQQLAAEALDLRLGRLEQARRLVTDPAEQEILQKITNIDKRFETANPKPRVPEPDVPEDSGVDTGKLITENREMEARLQESEAARMRAEDEARARGETPPSTPSTPSSQGDAPLGPKPEAEVTKRVYTPEELEAREAERVRRMAAREAERAARQEQRDAQKAIAQAQRDMDRAATAEERRMARETLAEAKAMEREAARKAEEARATWDASTRTAASQGQMPLDIEGNEGTGAQMGLPTESGPPPLTPEQEEIAARLREAEAKRIGEQRVKTEAELTEGVGERMEREQASRERGAPPPDVTGPGGQMSLGVDGQPRAGQMGLEEGPPLTPEQEEIARRLLEAEGRRGKKVRISDPVTGLDFFQAMRYSGLLSNPAGIIADAIGGPVEGLWKVGRDALMETGGKVSGRGGRPSAAINELAAGVTGVKEGWSTFWNEVYKPLQEGRPDKRIRDEALKKGIQRQERIDREVARRVAAGETREDALEKALDANPDDIIERLMNQRTPTGVSEVGRGLVRRLKAENEAYRQAGVEPPRGQGTKMVAAHAVEMPSRIRSAIDAANSRIAERMENARQATHVVTAEGYDPFSAEGRRRILELERNPTPMMKQKSKEAADVLTFRNDPGDFGNRLANLTHNPVGNFLMPMVKTGYNITRRGIDRTPGVGLASMGLEAAVNAGRGKGFQVERGGERLADQAMGTAAWYGLHQLAMNGMVTGSGPKDKTTRDNMIAQGWRPNSIKIGDAYHDYSRIGPVAYPLALAGATAEAQMFGDDDQDAQEYLTEVARNASYWGGNQLFLRSFGDLYESLRNFDTDMPRWAANAAASYGGPLTGGLGSSISSAFDPYDRERETPLDEVKFRIPGMRQGLPEKHDLYGEPVRNPGYGFGIIEPGRPGPTEGEIDPKLRNLRRYIGSHSAEEDLDIASAIRQQEDYENGTGPKPSSSDRRLALRFSGRENPVYEDVTTKAREDEGKRARLAG